MQSLLRLLVIAPFVAAILMVMTSKEDSKSSSRIAILMGIIFAAMSVALVAGGDISTDPVEWFHIPGCKGPVYYYLFASGFSSWMVLLSCGLSLVALISARDITCRSYRNFAIGIFSLMGAMNGTFLAADAVVFFFFFEAMVIPAAILIAGFGGKDRMKAAMTFAIYTLVGSAPMMVALWYLLTVADGSSMVALVEAVQHPNLIPEGTKTILFGSFLLAFLVKTPIFPFHGWQAISYAEAPAPLSAILTGAMSKAGVFGLIVWVNPIFPIYMDTASLLMWLGLFTAVYGALMALRATDGKKLLAFSSMGHLGLAVAGVFSGSEAMLQAVLVLLVAHGISAGAQFFLMGIAERMAGTRELDKLGGLSGTNPVFGTLFGFAGVMALAVPGTAGFVGEFSVLLALWDMGPLPALVAGFTLILSAAYMLRFIQKVIFGKPSSEYNNARRTTLLEGTSIGIMLLLLLVFGFHPAFVTDSLIETESTEDPAAIQVLNAAALNNGEVPMTAEEIHQLDSTLAAAGFKEDERASIIAQMKGVNDTEAAKSVKEASDAE